MEFRSRHEMRCVHVMMTALPPTIGHEALVRFATNFSANRTYLTIFGRSFEPMKTRDRAQAFIDLGIPNLTVNWYEDDNAPQNPPEDDQTEFWAYWTDKIKANGAWLPGDYIVASEMYGAKMAEVLGGTFIPYDIERSIVNTKATHVREDLFACFDEVMPTARRFLQKKVVFFGAESTGKTCLSKKFANIFSLAWRPEWARPYLEAVGPEVTPEKMDHIVNGQLALQTMPFDTPMGVFDTDLFSTLGYYRIYQGKEPNHLAELALRHKADLYLIMNSDALFVPDPLRYGGDKRESTDQFWVDICEEFGLTYHMMKETQYKQMSEVFAAIDKHCLFEYHEFATFKRE